MKLLLVIHSLSSGGAERVTTNLANHWAEKGWTVAIATIAGPEQDFYRLHPSIERHALALDKHSRSSMAAVRNNIRRIRALRCLLQREKPDLAIGMMSTTNILLAMAALGTGIPVVGSERIHPPMWPLGKVWESLRRNSYPYLSAVVAQTEESAHWLRVKTRAPRVTVIPNPVMYPLSQCEPRVSPECQEFKSRPNTLLAVGRLVPQKGFDRLLAAFAQLAPLFPDWNLTIVGEGTCRRELEDHVATLGLVDRVRLPGAVGNIGDWYQAADLYVMTSRFEGFPNTLLEALACGIAAVSVDCETGPREILRHDVDGLLVPQNDADGLVSALGQLMGDEALRRRFASRATEARERFAVDEIAKRWGNLLEDIVRRDQRISAR